MAAPSATGTPTVCEGCGRTDGAAAGYCRRCGGVRLVVEIAATTAALAPGQERTPVRPSRAPGLEGVLLKLESANVTGSFKDRVMRVLVRQAAEHGARGCVVASSGNAAVAAAAACAELGLPLLVLVPAQTPRVRTAGAELRGAAVVRGGAEPSAVHAQAARIGAAFGLANLASTFASPGCEWACRQIGRELAEQVPARISHVVVPVSAGPVLVGSGRGLVEAGRPLPALVAAQAAGCAPIAAAFEAGAAEVEPWTGPIATRALAIADTLAAYPGDGTFTLAQVRASGGFAAAVADGELDQMRSDLARWDGLDAELAACAAPALWRARGAGDGDAVVCLVTGDGGKEAVPAGDASADAPGLEPVRRFAAAVGAGGALMDEVELWASA